MGIEHSPTSVMRQVLRAQAVVPAVGLPKVVIQKYEESPLVVSD
jgi:hypothetical protein